MKTIILAGGLGTRISEETETKPKPMVLIDENPILWHIMNIYASQGFDEFIIATGYKGEIIDNWVQSLKTNWKISVLETGQDSQTGGRIQRCMESAPGERFFVTYGDGVANINLHKLLSFHDHQKRQATVTAVRPPARFGVLESHNGAVTSFGEKRQSDSGWINGGFFVLEYSVIHQIKDLQEPFETGALPRLVLLGELSSFHHEGFWQPMDTLREKELLAKYARHSVPPWLKDIAFNS
jgi:glucose-1-phosphate cytidylyltransferase